MPQPAGCMVAASTWLAAPPSQSSPSPPLQVRWWQIRKHAVLPAQPYKPSQSLCCLFQPNLTHDLTNRINSESILYILAPGRLWSLIVQKLIRTRICKMNWKKSLHIFQKKVQNGNLQIFKPRSNNIIFIYNIIFIIWFGTNIRKSCSKDPKLQIAEFARNDPKQQFSFEGKQDLDRQFANFTAKMMIMINLHTNDRAQQNLQKKKTQKDSLKILQIIIQNDNLLMSRQEEIFKHPPRQRRPTAQLTRSLQTITSSRHHPALPIDQNNRKKHTMKWSSNWYSSYSKYVE